MTITPQLASRRERVPADFAAMQDYFWEQGWTDGCPSCRPPRTPCGPCWPPWTPTRSAPWA